MPHVLILVVLMLCASAASSNASKCAENAKKSSYIETTYQLNVLHPLNGYPWVVEHETKVEKIK